MIPRFRFLPKGAFLKPTSLLFSPGKRSLSGTPVFGKPEKLRDSKAALSVLESIPKEQIRNWAVIAHIDHGKSTLSDCLLKLTGVIDKNNAKNQFLDKLAVERRRGITVKAQTCSMIYYYENKPYLLNLIDTPGHVDFREEVMHSLAACEGCILLVDASQGIQAQTLSNFYMAFAQNLVVLPVLNKVDLPTADVERTLDQIEQTFELDISNTLFISSKSGKNVEKILPEIVHRFPPPQGDKSKPLRSLLIDCWYNNYQGVISLVRLMDGTLQKGQKLMSVNTGRKYEVQQVGIMYPDMTETSQLRAGQVGYIVSNMKNIDEAIIGDTFTTVGQSVEPLPGFSVPKPMVFVGAFPTDSSDFERLNDCIEQLTLNDRAIHVEKETSSALGVGWRLGFLGTLHLSVFVERLQDEYGRQLLITSPTVPYLTRYQDGKEEIISNPNMFPSRRMKNQEFFEPIVEATIIIPSEYLGDVIKLCESCRGIQSDCTFLSESRCMLKYQIPLAHLVEDFFGKLKGQTSGYATLDYEDAGYAPADIVKLSVHVNGQSVDALCTVVHRSLALNRGREWIHRLRDLLPKQLYEVVIQAVVETKVLARQNISALRKNVTAKCYGGDWTRKQKLLNKQKEGKSRLRQNSNMSIDKSVFYQFLMKKTSN
ncbi:GTPase [Schizosaccharomyces cryophilus OY26]|uniref:GTPase n=1 Tax=Schizosaccharomyces cryophilus (strain OY26 / ATCC MYA-4695 / CBS 11777 / NBRC 106824 / NRRL Y48691) TaxID=653667 RepID=S9VY56_SCHCR|nr:GTPase [Schizosaccharomyces cryophilus OY26]EPY52563.1 GTPase [Schizosaccharomyces cryophilus OY26]